MRTSYDQHKQPISLAAFDGNNNFLGLTWPGPGMEDRCVFQIRAGSYLFQMKMLDLESGEIKKFYYTGNEWSENSTESAAVSLAAGETLELKENAG